MCCKLVCFVSVIRDCRRNTPAYSTFKMQRVFNVDSATDDSKWIMLRNKIDFIEVNLTNLQILTPRLHEELIQLINGLSVNFTAHRAQVRTFVKSDTIENKRQHLFCSMCSLLLQL